MTNSPLTAGSSHGNFWRGLLLPVEEERGADPSILRDNDLTVHPLCVVNPGLASQGRRFFDGDASDLTEADWRVEGGGGRAAAATTTWLYLVSCTCVNLVDRMLQRFLTQPLWSMNEREREREREYE